MEISFGCGRHLGTSRVYGPPCEEKRRLVRANPSTPGSSTLTLIYDAISDKRAASLGMVNGAFPTIPPGHTGPAPLNWCGT